MTSDHPNAAAAESAISQIGAEFRRLRTARGERLEDVAGYLDVKSTFIYGIEQGDLSVIPGKREAKSLVRRYADYLGLDGSVIIGRMTPIIASLQGENAPPMPKTFAGLDRTAMVLLGASVVLGILVGWSYIGNVNQFDLLAPAVTAEAVDAAGADDVMPAADVQADASDDAESALAEIKDEAPTSAEANTGGNTEIGALPAEGADDALAEKEERPANVLAALVAQRGDGAHIYEAQNTDARVIVRALSSSSVQVSSKTRDYIWTRTMKPKEMLLVPNRDDLELWTGDAGAVEILLDGTILPPLGPPGTVIGGLSLTPDFLREISAADLPEGQARPTF